MPITRRVALRGIGAAGAIGGVVRGAEPAPLRIAGKNVEMAITAIGDEILRLSVRSLSEGKPESIPSDGSLLDRDWGEPAIVVRSIERPRSVSLGMSRVTISTDPPTIQCEAADGRVVQRLAIGVGDGAVTFRLGEGPVLGLGEGGPQFDRRGSFDRMRSGQGGYRLRTHGGRVPIPWLVGTSGWGLFVHRPYGTFDLTGQDGRFAPLASAPALPIDLFIVTAREPSRILGEYARLTGLPEMPPRWAFGYQQSHRTLASRDEVIAEAKTFREKKLPCDTLIYLGTGFCPSGWNKGHGSFEFNESVFPDPKAVIDELHALHFHVVPHVVIRSNQVRGTVAERPVPGRPTEEHAASYWGAHRQVFVLGIDGWWPDEGDPLDPASRLARIRMYWDGPRLDRPNVRPFALHRNGYAGMQRYAAFLWSGDVYSTWETLKSHVPIAINASLSGMPYWGTDIGGFVPTKELTGELFVRWFQFGAFCPLFRAHGRTWKLRLPWGWNTGELGPDEIRSYGDAANPDPSELHNDAVEPICRKYLKLRSQLTPYLYSLVREGHLTGLPILRALWLHHPDDPKAAASGDEYLWGRDILVAPVTETGATSRLVYLPAGAWYDFWSGERLDGGREVRRPVDLATMPLFVRAGAIIPLGPVRQYDGEEVDGPLRLRVYPGADGRFVYYEDDGNSFDYQKGDWMGIRLDWDDKVRRLALQLEPGSQMRPPAVRRIEARLMPDGEPRSLAFNGTPIEIRL